MWDVLIVGGGPAGLSAALILGRCRRKVLLCDDGRPRNWAAKHVRGFLTRDGMPPPDLRSVARQQLERYPSVEIHNAKVVEAHCGDDGFEAVLEDGTRPSARKLLLATGVVDDLPPIEGAAEFYGRGVHHCPYCDGWEVRDRPLATYGRSAAGMALELTVWSRDIVLCTDGPAELTEQQRAQLARANIPVREERIARLEGEDELQRVRFATGAVLDRRALFFPSCGRQASVLAERLGCDLTGKGSVETGPFEGTAVPGLYVAGDASRNVQLVVIAAAEGATAAFAINTELLKEDLA